MTDYPWLPSLSPTEWQRDRWLDLWDESSCDFADSTVELSFCEWNFFHLPDDEIWVRYVRCLGEKSFSVARKHSHLTSSSWEKWKVSSMTWIVCSSCLCSSSIYSIHFSCDHRLTRSSEAWKLCPGNTWRGQGILLFPWILFLRLVCANMQSNAEMVVGSQTWCVRCAAGEWCTERGLRMWRLGLQHGMLSRGAHHLWLYFSLQRSRWQLAKGLLQLNTRFNITTS